MAASDSHVNAAKQRLAQGTGEPAVGYITPVDVQTAFGDLQTGWQADVADAVDAVGITAQDKTSPPVALTDSTNQQIARIDIYNDGSSTNNWPDRFHFRFESPATPGLFVRSGGFNEKGEIRADAAYYNSVPMRVHGYPSYIAGPQTANLFEVKLERAAAGPMVWVDASGRVFAPAAVTDPDQLATDDHVRAVAWVQWHGGQSAYDALADRDSGILYAIQSGAEPLVSFDGGSNGAAITAGGSIFSVLGTPTYTSNGIHGVGALLENGDTMDAALVKSGLQYSVSGYVRVDTSIGSSAVRVLLLVDAGGDWISYCRFSSNGNIEVTNGTTLAQTGPAWTVGKNYRVEAVSDTAGKITWRVYDGDDGTALWTSTAITPTDTSPPVTVRMGGTGGPPTFSLVWDTLRVSANGQWFPHYGGGIRALRIGDDHVQVGGLLSPSGQIMVSDDNTTAQQIITNSDITKNALRLDRTATATSVNDPDIFQVRYGGTRATWANEKGNLRTSNEASPNEDAFEVIGAATMGANYLAVTGYDATIHFRIGALGKTNVNSGMTCNNQRIEAVGAPTAASDAATKAYVDAAVALVVQRLGLDPDTPPPDDAHPDHLARWQAMFG